MPAPTLVQLSTYGTGSGSASVTLTNVVEGNTLAILYNQTAGAHRDYTVSDDVNGEWTLAVIGDQTSTRKTGIWYCEQSAGGDITVTVQSNIGTVVVTSTAVEITPAKLDQVGYDLGLGTIHPCGNIDVAANSFILAGGALNGSGGTVTSNPDYINLRPLAGSVSMWQYRVTENELLGEDAAWSSSTGREHTCVIASFVAKDSPGDIPENLSPPTLTINSTSFTGSVGSWDAMGAGPLTYEWELRDSTDSVIDSGTGTTISGVGSFSGSYYLWIKATNTHGSTEEVSNTEIVHSSIDLENKSSSIQLKTIKNATSVILDINSKKQAILTTSTKNSVGVITNVETDDCIIKSLTQKHNLSYILSLKSKTSRSLVLSKRSNLTQIDRDSLVTQYYFYLLGG